MLVPWEVLLFLVTVHLPSTVFIFVLGDIIKKSVHSKHEYKGPDMVHGGRDRRVSADTLYSFLTYSSAMMSKCDLEFIFMQIQLQGSLERSPLTDSSICQLDAVDPWSNQDRDNVPSPVCPRLTHHQFGAKIIRFSAYRSLLEEHAWLVTLETHINMHTLLRSVRRTSQGTNENRICRSRLCFPTIF
jgi:hypothetical protein